MSQTKMQLVLPIIAALLLAALSVGAYLAKRFRDPGPPNIVFEPRVRFYDGNFYMRVGENTWRGR